MEDYQIWGFTYLSFGNKNVNVITDNREEADAEFEVPCFDGVAYFEAHGNHYVARYPKYDELTEKQMKTIEMYCGYRPYRGEYGVIMGALGKIIMVSEKDFYLVVAAHPLGE